MPPCRVRNAETTAMPPLLLCCSAALLLCCSAVQRLPSWPDPKQRASTEPTSDCGAVYRVRTTDHRSRIQMTDYSMDCSTGGFQLVLPYRTAKDQSLSRRQKTLPRPDWARLAWRGCSPAGMGETARRTPSLLLPLGQCGQVNDGVNGAARTSNGHDWLDGCDGLNWLGNCAVTQVQPPLPPFSKYLPLLPK